MKTNIGIIVLFIFMILSSIAAAWDFFENDKHSYLDIITFLAGLSVFTFFLVTYKQFFNYNYNFEFINSHFSNFAWYFE